MYKYLHVTEPWTSVAKVKLRLTKIGMIFLLLSALLVLPAQAKDTLKNIKISIAVKNVTVREALAILEKQSHYKFFYESDLIDKKERVSIDLNGDLEEALQIIFSGRVSYRVLGKHIILERKQSFKTSLLEAPASMDSSVFFMSSPAIDSIVVRGIVKDENGEGLPGVNVVSKGTSNGTSTDAQGKFSLRIGGESSILLVSYIGYLPQEIIVGKQTEIIISLVPDAKKLDEVVVVGYGTQKKSEVTSAISSIKQEDLKVSAVSTISEALQGKAPGVEVINNSNSPGGDISVRIRGISSLNNSIQPLYIVDGFPIVGNISFLNANDIASIDILKDAASSAIYGSRGANGVVLITTHKGHEKEKFTVSADASVAFQNATRLIKMMQPTEFAQMIKTVNANDGTNLPVPTSTGAGTDWMKEITRSNAPMQNYTVTISGGSKKVLYSSSMSYFDQKGVAITSDYKRLNYRLNLDVNVTDKLKLGTSLLLTTSLRHFVPAEGDLWNSIFSQALSIDPITPVYKSAADLASNMISPNKNIYSIYEPSIYTPNNLNPVGLAARNFQKEGNLNIFANQFASYEIVRNLIFRSTLGLQYNAYNYYNFNPTFYETNGSTGNLTVNKLTENQNTMAHVTWQNTMNYNTVFGDHSLGFLAGQSYEHYQLDGINASTGGLPGDAANFRYLTYGTTGTAVSETVDKSAIMSVFARAVYNYRQKYFFTVTDRYDGSSKFADGHKWGNFPSISGGWTISNESFFKPEKISLLKLRFGWGKIGNQNIPSNSYGTFLRNNADYNFGGTLTAPGYSIQKAGNPNVSWETTTDHNLGLDFGLLENKLTGSVDVYSRKVSNLLLAIDPPEFTGLYNSYAVTGIITNVGAMRNKGIDIALNYDNTVGKLGYHFGGIFSKVQNEVLDLGPLPYIDGGSLRNITGYAERSVVGRPISQFYGFKTLGIFQTQDEVNAYTRNGALIQPGAHAGDFKFATNPSNSGATALGDADKQFLGSPLPKFTYGLNMGLKFIGFDLSTYFYGVYGNKIFQAQDALISNVNNSSDNLRAGLVAESWHGAGTSNTVPLMTSKSGNNNFSNVSSFYIQSGSYLRLKNLTLGYSLHQNLCSKLSLSRCRIYAGVQNLFTITKYNGFDPAVSNSTVSQVGVDFGGYPITRSYIVGCNIGL